MPSQIVTLLPSSVSYGHEIPPLSGDGNVTQVDLPVEVGGGSVVDGDDATYVQIGAWAEAIEGGRLDHIEPLSATFVLPSTYRNPTAVALNMRLASDPDALLPAPPDFTPLGVSTSLVSVSDEVELGANVSASGPSPYTDIVVASLPLGERSFWFGDIDPLNPTDAGGWFEFAVDADVPAEDCVAALTGSGIRATIAIYPGIILDASPVRRPWLDVMQFQLLVACDLAGGRTSLRQYPRDHPARLYPPPKSRRAAGGYR